MRNGVPLTASGVALGVPGEVYNIIVTAGVDAAVFDVYDGLVASGNKVRVSVPAGMSYGTGRLGYFETGVYVKFVSGTAPSVYVVFA